MVVRSLFDLCVLRLGENDARVENLQYAPAECKQRLLQFISSHDKLLLSSFSRLVMAPRFGIGLTRLEFFLSDDITDDMLIALTEYNKQLEVISLVECSQITNKGVLAVTREQGSLRSLELRSMRHITDEALVQVRSPVLTNVDLSGCSRITSVGVYDIVSWNRALNSVSLNSCSGLDDQALYHIAYYCGERLTVLNLDFMTCLEDPVAALWHVSNCCPNISQLSLARFFNDLDESMSECQIGGNLRDVDLYGNFFTHLPRLPPTIRAIRLSVSGDEDPIALVAALEQQPYLSKIDLQLTCRDASITAVDNANRLLCTLIPLLGSKVVILQVAVQRLFDDSLSSILECTPNLQHLAFDVQHLNNILLHKYFSGKHCAGSRLRSLKMCRMRVTYRVLFAIARGARSLQELETSHMYAADDRFLTLLAQNCKFLQAVNFNGCKYVSDKGLAAMARRCPLKEVRIRATACTDKSIYLLAQFCPDMEWISHADFSGKPKFTDAALQCLRDSCIQRVIC